MSPQPLTDLAVAWFEIIAFLADVRDVFRQMHIFVDRQSSIRSASVSVIPMKMKRSGGDYADEGIVLTVSIDADLSAPPDKDKRSIGASLLLRRALGTWLAEAEIGWTGAAIGWDSFESEELQADSLEALVSEVPALVERLRSKFEAEVLRLPRAP